MNELKEWALAIVDIYSDLNRITEREAGILRKAITMDRPQGEWVIVKDEKWGDNVKCPFCGKELAGTDLNFCCKCGASMKGGAE